jgi:hypothetical protein
MGADALARIRGACSIKQAERERAPIEQTSGSQNVQTRSLSHQHTQTAWSAETHHAPPVAYIARGTSAGIRGEITRAAGPPSIFYAGKQICVRESLQIGKYAAREQSRRASICEYSPRPQNIII